MISHLKFINGREDRIRTCDLLVPNQALYQAKLLPENGAPKRSRTPNLLIRSQALYPIELWARIMAVLTGIEPAIFGVTDRHVNRYTTGPKTSSKKIITYVYTDFNTFFGPNNILSKLYK